jgi:hypothetical protein
MIKEYEKIMINMSKDFHKMFDKYEDKIGQIQTLYSVFVLTMSIGIQIAPSDQELNKMIVESKKKANQILKETMEKENDKS